MADVFDDDEDKERAEDRRQKLQERQERDLAKVMESSEGRRFYRRLMVEVCRYDESPFSQNSLVMANLVGRREVGVFLRKQLDKLPVEIRWKMEREAANDLLLREMERKADNNRDGTS